jgi:hypothetical protein
MNMILKARPDHPHSELWTPPTSSTYLKAFLHQAGGERGGSPIEDAPRAPVTSPPSLLNWFSLRVHRSNAILSLSLLSESTFLAAFLHLSHVKRRTHERYSNLGFFFFPFFSTVEKKSLIKGEDKRRDVYRHPQLQQPRSASGRRYHGTRRRRETGVAAARACDVYEGGC